MRGSGGSVGVRWSGRRGLSLPTHPPSRVRGTTMIELLVVLVLLGLVSGISVVAVATLRSPNSQARLDGIQEGRSRAVRSGQEVVLMIDSLTMRFLPDGRVLGLGVDPLTGEASP